MPSYTAKIQKLEQDFRSSGIDIDKPGFYDDPKFVAIERRNPDYLNNYASFVAQRNRSPEYDSMARRIVPLVANTFHRRLVENGRLGACVDISSLISRALEREGVWNYVVKGSLTMNFPRQSKIPPQYFYSIDTGDFVAGHAWVVAPPFHVVDVTVKLQPFRSRQDQYLPETVMAESVNQTMGEVTDIVSPEIRVHYQRQGVKEERLLSTISPQTIPFLQAFPAALVQAGEVSLKYIPFGVGAPDVPFEKMTALRFEDRTGFEVYINEILPKVRENAA